MLIIIYNSVKNETLFVKINLKLRLLSLYGTNKKKISRVLPTYLFYPAICRTVRPPPQNSAEAKKLGGSPAARKRPIGEG
ncbi:hypothetical protein EXW62_21290 [Bacillus mycoides]|nr:hypothetical protein EXW62_21290 [Bacillus mycoides]